MYTFHGTASLVKNKVSVQIPTDRISIWISLLCLAAESVLLGM